MAGIDDEPQADAPRAKARRDPRGVVRDAALVLRAYRSESSIYGVVLVGSLIAIAWRE